MASYEAGGVFVHGTPTVEGRQRAAEVTMVGETVVTAVWQINRAVENGDVEASCWLAEHLDDYEALRDRAHAHELWADQLPKNAT